MKKILFFTLFFVPLLASAELVDRIVAIVGDEIITLSDVKKYKAPPKKDPLEELIRQKILLLEIDQLGIDVTNDDLANAIGEVLTRNRIQLEELKKELEKEGKGFEQYKQELRTEIRKMKFLGQVIYPRIKVSEEEILRKLGKNPSDEDRIRARRQIVESRLNQELENYLDEVRQKTYIEIKK